VREGGIMKRADVVGGVLLVLGFAAALWEATTFQYRTEFAPGPGFAPVWISVLGILIGLAIAASAWHGSRSGFEAAAHEAPNRAGIARVVATLLGLLAMMAAVPWIGFVAAIFVFLLFLTLAVQRLRLWAALGASVGTVLFVYIVFVRLLEVPIPAGPLGF
jgi:putative tricarboxylic transport membrane protein